MRFTRPQVLGSRATAATAQHSCLHSHLCGWCWLAKPELRDDHHDDMKVPICILTLRACCFLISRLLSTMDHEKIYQSLTKSIDEISFKSDSIPSELFLYGPNAVPIIVQESGEILIAAATYGQGRIVVLPHEAYLSRAPFKQFLLNCLAWLHEDQNNSVVVHKNLKKLKSMLEECKFLTTFEESFDGVGTYCCAAATANRPKEILRHVKNGGGLLIAGQAWHWASVHDHKNEFVNYPSNKITGPAGIFISSKTVRPSVVQISKNLPSVDRLSRVTFYPENDQALLTEGIDSLSLNIRTNLTGLFTFDPFVFPVDLPSKIYGHVVAGRLGAGRFVVTAHSKVFDNANGSKFLGNVIKWLLNGNDKGQVLLDKGMKELECSLKLDYDCREVKFNDASVFCCCTSSKVEPDAVKAFVEEGGGLLWCGQDCQSCDIFIMKQGLVNFPGNEVLNPLGVGILPSTLKGDAAKLVKFSSFFETVSKYLEESGDSVEPECKQTLVKECAELLKSQDFGSCRYAKLLDELMKLACDSECLPPCQAKVFKSEKSKFVVSILADLFDVLPEKKSSFIPPQNKIQTEKEVIITVDIQNEAKQTTWVSTGLYAVPGETVTVIVPQQIIGKSVQVQIGCHSDQLFKKSELKRAPVVIRRMPLRTDVLEVCYLWGGLIYFLVPGNCDLGKVQVIFQNAAKAPFFKLGKCFRMACTKIRFHKNFGVVLGRERGVGGVGRGPVWGREAKNAELQSRPLFSNHCCEGGMRQPRFQEDGEQTTPTQDLQEGFGWEAFMNLHDQYRNLSCGSQTNEAKMNIYAEMFSKTVKKNLVPFFKAWGWNIKDTVAQQLSTLDEWEDDPMKRFYDEAAVSCTKQA
ncbi:Peptidase family M60 domain [Trinorchestia longiramus]|nr:Peptidase family M60 domain [Trinorchestia longiramus]